MTGFNGQPQQPVQQPGAQGQPMMQQPAVPGLLDGIANQLNGGQVDPNQGQQFVGAPAAQPQQYPVAGQFVAPAQQPAPQGTFTQEQVQQMLAQAAAAAQSETDRRVNQVVGTLRSEFAQTLQAAGVAPQGQVGQPQPQGQPAGSQSAPSASNLQEGRSAYREFVNDEVKFLGPAERELAQSISGVLLAERIGQGESPERAGRAVARDVATQIKAIRSMYESQVLGALAARGVQLPAVGGQQPLQPGQASQQLAGQASGFATGAAKAQEMYRNRQPPAAAGQ
jgi:hypothetical protein